MREGEKLTTCLVVTEMKFWVFFKILFIDFQREGKGGRKRGRGTSMCETSITYLSGPSTGDLAVNPGMCPDQESNQWPFDLQASAQSPEPHQQGHLLFLMSNKILFRKTWVDIF